MNVDTLEKLRAYQMNILGELDRICKKYDLTYYAAWGTALGAVRHQGFIPWDDDIDVHMPYEDYKKLEQVSKEELGEQYYFQSRRNNPQNFVFWNRIGLKDTTSIDINLAHIHADWGICIDIFPVFFIGDNQREIDSNMKYLDMIKKICLKYLMIGTADQYSGIEKIKRKIHGLVPDWLNLKVFYYYLEKLGNLKKKKYCVVGNHLVFETKWFENLIVVPFENIQIPLMQGYNDYLKTIYGDYMSIPKEENRQIHVDESVILKFDEPYQKYYK